MGGLSWIHWVVVLLVVVLIFGTKKLRNIGTDFGSAVKGFKDGMKSGATDGSAGDAGTAVPPSQQVGSSSKASDPNTVDVEAKSRS